VEFYVVDGKRSIILGSNWTKAMNCCTGYKDGKQTICINNDVWVKTENMFEYEHDEAAYNERVEINHVRCVDVDATSIDPNDDDRMLDDFEFKPTINLCDELAIKEALTNKEVKGAIQSLLPKIEREIAASLQDLETCNLGSHKINLIDDKPVFVPQYRRSVAEQKIIATEIKQLLDAGIIRPSRSEYSSRVFLVKNRSSNGFEL